MSRWKRSEIIQEERWKDFIHSPLNPEGLSEEETQVLPEKVCGTLLRSYREMLTS